MVTNSDLFQITHQSYAYNTKILTNLVLKQLTKQCYKKIVVTSFPCALIDVSLCDIRGNTIYPLVVDSL